MKGDFSRDTFDKRKHFSRVLMQQGRVQLDADWNEQADILLHYLRTLAADLIGPFGTPAGGVDPKDPNRVIPSTGFEITKVDDAFTIGKGRYYVDGILCENDASVDVTYISQVDYPNPPPLEKEKSYLVYLDVWERYISAVDNDEIREKALGGPDTTGRSKVVWQVKIEDTIRFNAKDGNNNVELTPDAIKQQDNWRKLTTVWQASRLGCLRAQVERPESANTPCLTEPDAKYRGTENQLYRVEIHQGGQVGGDGPKPTFKWSRDNGAGASVCILEGKELMVDDIHGFAANQWVELLSEGQELRGEPGTLVSVIKVEGDKLLLEDAVSKPQGLSENERKDWPTKVRRWDHVERGNLKLEQGGIVITESTKEWIHLEEGIQIQFLPVLPKKQPEKPVAAGAEQEEGKANGQAEVEFNRYRSGDYWLIPARVATGSIEWPGKDDKDGKRVAIPQRPRGVVHHYAPLALLTAQDVKDCRCAIEVASTCKQQISHGDEGLAMAADCEQPG